VGKQKGQKTALIHVEGGSVQDVEGLPSRFDYQVFYWDDDDSIWPEGLAEYVNYILRDGRKNPTTDTAARVSAILDRLDMGSPADLKEADKEPMQRIENARRLAPTDPEAFLVLVKALLPPSGTPEVGRSPERSDAQGRASQGRRLVLYFTSRKYNQEVGHGSEDLQQGMDRHPGQASGEVQPEAWRPRAGR